MTATSSLNFNTGLLVRWNADKGYGFIDHKEHRKGIFVHITAFEHPERKPIVGDTILYQLVVGKDNKLKAIDAYIKGVKRIPKLPEPKVELKLVEQSSQDNLSNNKIERVPPKKSYKQSDRPRKSYRRSRLKEALFGFSILAIIYVSGYVYQFLNRNKTTHVEPVSFTTIQVPVDEKVPADSFKCDGRIYCSQMNSRAEARFFADHCPGTKMRSTPGEPCKNDSRW